MKVVPASRVTLCILCAAALFAALACLLPDRDYQRWQLLDGTIQSNARWIFERIHYDDTPIDVAFIGPSRVGAGINAPRLARALRNAGLPDNVVNFALPEAGRDINYVIVREMLSAKEPKLIVIGVTEKPSRFGHPAFKFIADASDVVDPGYLMDANFLSNLVYLPYRQIKLFAATLFPAELGLAVKFDRQRYPGSSIDTTGDGAFLPGSPRKDSRPAPFTVLERDVRSLQQNTHPPILPARFSDFEFGDERHYIRAIAALARAHHVSVAFVFIPYYTDKDVIQENALYSSIGPVWDARFLAPHAELFADYGHLTHKGAEMLTDWLASRVAGQLRDRAGQLGDASPQAPQP